jgi:hypothetical protein
MGGRASEVYGVRILHPGYGTVWPPPPPPSRRRTPAPEVVEAEVVEAEVVEPIEVKPIETNDTTITDIDGGLSLLGRWLIRFWLRIHVQRR